jgi:hypothetical protein
MAIASMVLSFLWLGGVGSLLGILVGWIALQQLDQSPENQEGRTQAILGIVSGVIGLLLTGVLVLELIVLRNLGVDLPGPF